MKKWLLFLMLCMPAITQAQSIATLKFHTLTGESVSLPDEKTLVILWRADCAPCQKELAALPKLAREQPEVPFILIALHGPKMTGNSFATKNLPANVQLWMAEDTNETVLDALGDTRHALPYSMALHADGTVCQSHQGMLGADRVKEWSTQC